MYEQEVGERHQCHQSGWRTCLLCAEHVELYAYQPLRDYTHAQEQARIWPVWLVASTDLRSSRTWSGCQACLWMLLNTEHLAPWLHRTGREYFLVLYTVRGRHSFHSFDVLDRYLTVHVKRHVRVYAPADSARYQLKQFFGELMERRSRMLVAFSGYFSVTVIGTDRFLKDIKLIFFNGSK